MTQGAVDQLIAASVADGTANTAGTRASCIPTAARATLRPGFFDAAGQMLRITATGKITHVDTTPGTARFDVTLGSVATPIIVWDSLAVLLDTVEAHTDAAFWLEVILTCRAVGSGTSANLIGIGHFTSVAILGQPTTAPKGTPVALLPWNTAPGVAGTGFNSTIENVLDLYFTQTVGTGSMTLQQYCVEELN